MRCLLTILVALAALVAGCDVDPRACASQTDCFAFEVCVEGLCQSQPRPDAETDSGPLIDCRVAGTDCGFLVCNELTGRCEDCLTDDQCDQNEICDRANGVCVCAEGSHLCDDLCVDDDQPATCGDRCEPCPAPPRGIATCEQGACGFECEPGFVRCDGPDCIEACQECVSNADCGPDAPVCSDGVCSDCQSSADCAPHAPDAGVCNVSSGSCVECSANEREPCDGRACNVLLGQCTQDNERSVEACGPCDADLACPEDYLCAVIDFDGATLDRGRCLKVADVPVECRRPFSIIRSYETTDGVHEDFCGFQTDNTTCQAILDYGRSCGGDNECGVSGFSDAVCRDFPGGGTERRCSYVCDNEGDCESDSQCISGLYCYFN